MNEPNPPTPDPATPDDVVTPSEQPATRGARHFDAWLRSRLSPLFVLLLCAVFAVVGINIGLTVDRNAPPPVDDCAAPSADFALLCEAYGRIKADYVDDINDRALVEAAVRGMIEFGLEDPYSGYMGPVDYRGALDTLSGEFGGIGAEITVAPLEEDSTEVCTVVSDDCALTVVAPIDDSPAAEAGLRTGDVIVAVDGVATDGKNAGELVLEIRGESGTSVELGIERDGDTLEMSITREVIEINPVRTEMLAGDIGYLRLATFSDESAQQMGAALEKLLDDGATSLVFDLRSNPGGYITAAQGVASHFIEDGLIFTVDDGEGVEEWEATGNAVLGDPQFEVVVLIDPGSASASEIVAAALAEHDRATIVGAPSFGKDTVQTWAELANEGGLRLTIARWYTPDGNLVSESEGVQPDVLVTELPSGPDNDPALDAAIELLSE